MQKHFTGRKITIFPPEDSDDNDLSEDVNRDNEDYIQPQQVVNDSSSEEVDISELDDVKEVDEQESFTSAIRGRMNSIKQKKVSTANKWTEGILDSSRSKLPFTGNEQLPADILELKTPLKYFHRLFTTELEMMIVEQTNLFATQMRPEKPLKLSTDEFQQFPLCMTLVKLPL